MLCLSVVLSLLLNIGELAVGHDVQCAVEPAVLHGVEGAVKPGVEHAV